MKTILSGAYLLLWSSLAILIVFCLPLTVVEAAATDTMESGSVKVFTLMVKMVASLILIAILIYGLIRFLSIKSKGYQQGRMFRMCGGCSLGPNKSLQLVQVGDSFYLLGVGNDIQLIRHIQSGPEVEQLLAIMQESESTAINSPLSGLAAKLLPGLKHFIPVKMTEKMQRKAPGGNQFQTLLREKLQEIRLRNQEPGSGGRASHEEERDI